MKILVLLLLIGFASASPLLQSIYDAAEEFPLDLIEEMDMASKHLEPLHADESDEGTESEIADKLREALNKVLQRIKEAFEKGKIVKHELLQKLKEIRDKMHELRVEVGDKERELWQKIKEHVRERLQKLLEILGFNREETKKHAQRVFSDVNLRDLLHKVREHVLKNVDPEVIKQGIEKLFDQGSEIVHQLLQILKEKGRKKLLMLLDVLLDDYDVQYSEYHGIADYWEKVKDYFKDLKIDLQEKYMKFGEWVKNVFDKGMEHSKDKMENIKAIAKEFAKHAKNISKEVGAEAMDFFRDYKEELGDVWELIKEAYQRIKDRED